MPQRRLLTAKHKKTGTSVTFWWNKRADPTPPELDEIFADKGRRDTARAAKGRERAEVAGAAEAEKYAATQPSILPEVGREFLEVGKGLGEAGLGILGATPPLMLARGLQRSISEIGPRWRGEIPTPTIKQVAIETVPFAAEAEEITSPEATRMKKLRAAGRGLGLLGTFGVIGRAMAPRRPPLVRAKEIPSPRRLQDLEAQLREVIEPVEPISPKAPPVRPPTPTEPSVVRVGEIPKVEPIVEAPTLHQAAEMDLQRMARIARMAEEAQRLDRQTRMEVEEHMRLSGETDRAAALQDVLEARKAALPPVKPLETPPEAPQLPQVAPVAPIPPEAPIAARRAPKLPTDAEVEAALKPGLKPPLPLLMEAPKLTFEEIASQIESGRVYHGTTLPRAESIIQSGKLRPLKFDDMVDEVLTAHGMTRDQLSPHQLKLIKRARLPYETQEGTASVTPAGEVATRWAGKGGEIAQRIEEIVRGRAKRLPSIVGAEPAVVVGSLRPGSIPALKAKAAVAPYREAVRLGEMTEKEAAESLWTQYYDIRVRPEDFIPERVIRDVAELKEGLKAPLAPPKRVAKPTEVPPPTALPSEIGGVKVPPGMKVTKLPPGPVPEGPIEFGRPFEEKLARAEKRAAKAAPVGEEIPEGPTQSQLRRLIAPLAKMSKERRLSWASKTLGRPITSFKDLTKTEASKLIDAWEMERLAGKAPSEAGFINIGPLADWIRKLATGKDPATGVLLPAEEIPLQTFMRDYLTTSIKTSLRKIGAPAITQMLKEARAFEYRIAGHAVEAFKSATDGLSKAEVANLALAIEGKAKFVNPKVAAAAETVKSVNRVIGNAMESAGVTLKAASGKAVPFKMRDPTGAYWHHEYTREFWKGLGKEGPTREAVIRSLMGEKGISRFEAENIIKMARRFGEKRISAQYAREWDFPGYRLDTDAMIRYYGEAAERIARAKVLGPKDITDPSSPIGRALSAMEAEGKDVSTAYNYLARILERDTPPATYKYKVASAITNVLTTLYLQMFPISNLVQIPMAAIHAPVRAFVKGIFGAALDYKGASKRALKSGATLEAHKVVRDIAGKYINKTYLMTKSEILNRTTSDNVGRYAAQTWFDGLKRNPNNKLLRRKLEDITLGNADEMLRRGSLNARELDYAGYNMSVLTNGTVHIEDMPYAWSNSPLARLAWIFQRYAFSTGANIWRSIKMDPLRTIPKIAFFQLSAGEVIGDLKKFITEGMEGVERRGEWIGIENEAVARLLDNALQGWALGIPGDVFAGLWVRGEIDRFVPLDFVDEVTRAVRDLTRGKPKPIIREALQRAPIPFGIAKRAQKELLPTEKQKGARGVPSPPSLPSLPPVSPP